MLNIMRGWRTRRHRAQLCAALAVAAAAVAARDASAQTVAAPSAGMPQTVVIPTRPGDTSTDSAGLPLDLAMMPLRLSLSSGLWPLGPSVPGCETNAANAGNTWNLLPLQRAAAMHVLPRLTLVGFSSTQCAVDANAHVGATYVAPLRRDLWLVASGGVSIFPTTSSAPRAGLPRGDLRMDVVFKATPSNTFSVGLGRRGLLFGGAF